MNEDIKTAIDCPRPHHQLVPMKIDYEIGEKQVKIQVQDSYFLEDGKKSLLEPNCCKKQKKIIS